MKFTIVLALLLSVLFVEAAPVPYMTNGERIARGLPPNPPVIKRVGDQPIGLSSSYPI